ncbi:MAG TPA: hypothetical protein VNQ79_01550 [Blastocatellia bacterium]|nr:hypothetical protein [Blastocatellia bacterium]
MKTAKSTFALLALLLAFSASQAFGQSCQTLLNDLVAHASTPLAGGENYVTFRMVGNREASDWAQYAEGELHYRPGFHYQFYLFGPFFSGEGTQFFSDRTWTEKSCPGDPPSFGSNHPFSPYATDKLKISFDIRPLSANNGKLTYTLASWGNASETVTPTCQGNYLFATLSDQTLVFTFKKASIVYPR